MGDCGHYSHTICWDCKKAVNDCSWSRNFEPVEGWEAIPYYTDREDIKSQGFDSDHPYSYEVHYCPLFDCDERSIKLIHPRPTTDKPTTPVPVDLYDARTLQLMCEYASVLAAAVDRNQSCTTIKRACIEHKIGLKYIWRWHGEPI